MARLDRPTPAAATSSMGMGSPRELQGGSGCLSLAALVLSTVVFGLVAGHFAGLLPQGPPQGPACDDWNHGLAADAGPLAPIVVVAALCGFSVLRLRGWTTRRATSVALFAALLGAVAIFLLVAMGCYSE